MSRLLLGICLGGALNLAFIHLVTVPVQADIYRYVDENGVWHFTNIKSDTRYRLFLRTARKPPVQYIHAYRGVIDQAATQFGIDPHFIRAIIKAESSFNHQAVSSKGAKGLMQLMPDTADDMAVKDPLDPEENIFGGARYISLLLKRFKNDKILALAAYNAGPETVESFKGVPPFPETRDFVNRVMQYYETYQQKAR